MLSLALYGLVILLTLRGDGQALAGTIVGYLAGYWLPTRPNRRPPQ